MSGFIDQLIRGSHWASGMFDLPLWMAGAVAALAVVLCLVAFGRAGVDGIVGSLSRTILILAALAVAWVVLDARSTAELAARRESLDARVLALTTRAIATGSPLACLDATAGETVEASCEKALFATPETVAAAVSYVAAQLSLLADATEYARRGAAGYESTLSTLRHSAEADRFGIVAHVLSVRDGCTPDQCSAFGLLHDAGRLAANLAERTYDNYVMRHAAEWPTATGPAVAAPMASQPVAAAKTPSGNYFPSSASTPSISIMSAEPAAPQQQGAAVPDVTGKLPMPPRKPAPPAQQARRPTNLAPQGRPAPAPEQPTDQ
jgi:hypothetical protein